jgi:hypothetical protein
LLDVSAERQELLETDPITLGLRKLGVTTEQLTEIRFSHRRQDFPFSGWSFVCPADLPPQAQTLLRPYAALKYLCLEDPPPSADRDAAWELIAQARADPIIKFGRETKERQSARAKKSRNKISTDGPTIREAIESLTKRFPDASAVELWEMFFQKLDNLGRTPRKIVLPNDPSKDIIEFEGATRKLKIGLERFRSIVSEIRRKNNSR